MKPLLSNTGGRGGDARVHGDGSEAQGGEGGEAAGGNGGGGGDAKVRGHRSKAVGGRGGRGGIGPGGPGGHAEVEGDDAQVIGGQGGEAPQHDGRGGRGGRAGGQEAMAELFGVTHRPRHMRWPYGEPVTEPGRGGDSADTPQYKARRLIVEGLKEDYFSVNSLPRAEAWWDREVVPLAWINERLAAMGHRWGATVVDDEYEFHDLD